MEIKKLANVLLNDFKGLLNKNKVDIKDCGIDPEDLMTLVKLHYCGVFDKKQLRELLEKRIVDYKTNHD